MTAVTTEIVHFGITGAAFTRLVRGLMLRDKVAGAWRSIVAGLRHEGTDSPERYASKILDGTMRLAGTEKRMYVVADTSKRTKDYAAQIRSVYAGRIRINNLWYRPYAEVTDFGPEDAHHGTTRKRTGQRTRLVNAGALGDATTALDQGMHQWWVERVAFYSREGDRIVAVRSGKKKPKNRLIIFEPCAEAPHWWKEHKTFEDALANFLSTGCVLVAESYTDRFPAEHREEDDDGEDDTKEEETVDSRTPFWNDVEAAVKADRDKREKEMEERWEREDRERRELNDQIRTQVLEQAAGDMMDLHTDDGTLVATVPRAPFVQWALERTSLRYMAPPWKTVARSGHKLQMDNPNHTDWFYARTMHANAKTSEPAVMRCMAPEEVEALRKKRAAMGADTSWAGQDVDDPYRYDYTGLLHDAAYHELFELQFALGHFQAAVVVDAGEVYGTVGTEIVVLADLQPDHVGLIAGAKGIVTETGGQVAHIAQLALERNVTIMRVTDARARYPEGSKVRLQPAQGAIHIDVKRW